MDRNWRRLAWGVALMALGLLFLGHRLGWWPAVDLRWWGLVLVGLGALALVEPRRAGDVGNGILFIGFGVWSLLASTHAYGFTWSNSWPMALVALGAGTIAHGIAARWLPDSVRLRRRYRHVHDE